MSFLPSKPPDILKLVSKRYQLLCICLSAFLCALIGLPSIDLSSRAPSGGLFLSARAVEVNALDANALVNEGVSRYQVGDFKGAIETWQTSLRNFQDSLSAADRATVLENLARVHRRVGHTNESLEYWAQAVEVAQAANDLAQLGRLKTEQGQTYSRLGQHGLAIALLCGSSEATNCEKSSALGLAEGTGDRTGRVAALGALGEVLRLRREYSQAQHVLEAGLTGAEELGRVDYQTAALSSLGTLYRTQAQARLQRAKSIGQTGDGPITEALRTQAAVDIRQAREHFEASREVARQAQDNSGLLRSQLNLIPIYRQLQQPAEAKAAQQTARSLLQQAPNSADKVDATIMLANLIQFDAVDLSAGGLAKGLTGGPIAAQCFTGTASRQTQALLTDAIEQARALEDSRGETMALGTLGHWYECQKAYPQALQLTQQALWLDDQQRQAQDSIYLWQWQAGRIYLAQNKKVEARSAYDRAVITLNEIRNDLLASNRELQFDFRDTVEPVYRQLIALQLDIPPILPGAASEVKNSSSLWEAISTLDSLKLAELQNYFGSDCEIVPFAGESPTGLTGLGNRTATIHSIVLSDRTAVIASLPSGRRWITWIPADAATLRATINDLRRKLERFYDLSFNPVLSQQVYDWIIRPFEPLFEAEQIETLVFVNDGILRSVPMAALHDGEKFLVQTYATATVPTISLTAQSNLTPRSARALVVGLTQATTIDGRAFPALPFVDEEVYDVQNIMPNAQVLLDSDFNRQRLEDELEDRAYSVLHMATHGQFGANPEDAFLITGQGEKLTFGEMDRLIRGSKASGAQPIEMLALTACETAIGDERAALGVGGVAVRAGAKSAIASLWSISDESTAPLVARFYRGLMDESLSKAKALQAAQISSIEKNQHPAFWSPLIVVGNWL